MPPSTRSSAPARFQTTLSFLFFLSGAAALVFETLWFRLSGLVFGNSVWGSALVLSSFMAGLALGNGLAARYGARIRRPLVAYALLEVLVGVFGVGLVLLLPHLAGWLAPLLQPLIDRPALLNGLRFAGSFALLMVPATAMGTTLPILVKALIGADRNFGAALGRLYGWNTLGAVGGTLLAELALIDRFGLTGSSIVAAAMSGIAALGALGMAQDLGASEATPGAARAHGAVRWTPRALGILAASFLSGGILLAFEVLWFRFLQLYFAGTTMLFAVLLAVVLAGIGLGGLCAGWWSRTYPTKRLRPVAIALVGGVLSTLSYALYERALLLRPEPGAIPHVVEALWLGLWLIFPTSFASGLLFPALGRALFEELGEETRATGWATLANTVGAALGPLLAGFVLIPGIGMERAFLVLSAGYGLVALALLRRPVGRVLLEPLLAAGCLAAWLAFPHGQMERFLAASRKVHTDAGAELVVLREGRAETIQYLREPFLGETIAHRLVTNGYSMSATSENARRYMKYYVYWPVALHPDPEQALLISYGCGSTAKALVDTDSLRHIDIVDVSEEILELSSVVYPDDEENPLHDERVDVHVDDGRFFLQGTEHRYDLITSEPPPPKLAGIVNLYSKEYFQLIHDRLAEGGVATYWLPVKQLHMDDTKAILRAFLDVFGDETTLWTGCGFEWMMVGTRGLEGPVDRAHFERQWRDPEVAPELVALGFELPAQIGATFLMDAADLREHLGGREPLSDDFPGRLSKSLEPDPGSMVWYAQLMDPRKAHDRFQGSETVRGLWPADLLEDSLAYFPAQEAINTITMNPRKPLDFAILHYLLTKTPLTAPILWSGGSSARKQAILAARSPEELAGDPDALYLLGIGALAERDYVRAEVYVRRADELLPEPQHLPMRAYLLCMSGAFDEARALEREHADRFASSRQLESFLDWLHRSVTGGLQGT